MNKIDGLLWNRESMDARGILLVCISDFLIEMKYFILEEPWTRG